VTTLTAQKEGRRCSQNAVNKEERALVRGGKKKKNEFEKKKGGKPGDFANRTLRPKGTESTMGVVGKKKKPKGGRGRLVGVETDNGSKRD